MRCSTAVLMISAPQLVLRAPRNADGLKAVFFFYFIYQGGYPIIGKIQEENDNIWPDIRYVHEAAATPRLLSHDTRSAETCTIVG
jgi:hypothetical protein